MKVMNFWMSLHWWCIMIWGHRIKHVEDIILNTGPHSTIADLWQVYSLSMYLRFHLISSCMYASASHEPMKVRSLWEDCSQVDWILLKTQMSIWITLFMNKFDTKQLQLPYYGVGHCWSWWCRRSSMLIVAALLQYRVYSPSQQTIASS